MILSGDTRWLGIWDSNAMVWKQTNSDRVITPEEIERFEMEERERKAERVGV